MAIQWGNTSGYFRLGIDLVGQTLIVYGQSVGYGHSWSETLSRSGSWSGSTAVSFYSGTSQTVTKELYRQTVSASGTYTASISYWNGSSSVSRKVSFGSAPGQVTGITLNRTSDVDMIVKWNAVSGATGYKVWRSLTGTSGSWILTKQNATTTSHTMPNMPVNERHYISVSAYNSVGTGPDSAVAGPFYSKPAAPTNLKGTVTATGYSFTMTNNAKYKYGVEVQRVGGSTYSNGTGTSGTINSVEFTLAYGVDYKFRARAFAGPEGDRSYSDWTSEVIAQIAAPSLSATAFRATGSTANPAGTTLRVTASGGVPAIAGNTMTLRARARVKGGSWGAYTTNKNAAVGGTFGATSFNLTTPATAPITSVYEVQVELIDKWGVSASQTIEVPVGQVAFSLSKTGAGVGKVWQRGALDVEGDVYVNGNVIPTDPNVIVIDGTAYQASGTWTTPSLTFVASGSVALSGIISTSHLPAVPVGWTRAYTPIETNFNSATVIGVHSEGIRAIGVNGHQGARSLTIAWQLVKI